MIDSRGNQSIHGPLIRFAHLRNNLHHDRCPAHIDKLHESDQLIIAIRANKAASIQVSTVFTFHGDEILLVMPEPLTVP